MTWRKVTISTFLNERKGRYKPDEAMRMKLKRIDKIDFSNNIHLSETTETKTDMILVKQGDLVISGINAEKGAIAIYRGEEDIMATIHYSSYTYNEKEIDIDYLKWFLKSETFLNTLKEQTKGGIKTELKPNRLLPLEIYLPDKPTQKQILKKLNNIEEEVLELEENIDDTADMLKRLRLAILQDAVKGKLVKQNPKDEPATELLKRIKAEKEKLVKQGKCRSEKPFPKIQPEEIPYGLPSNWIWCRLGDVINLTSGQHINELDYNNDGKGVPYLTGPSDFGVSNPIFTKWSTKPKVVAYKDEILITVKGSGVGKTNTLHENNVAIGRQLMAIRNILVNQNFIHYYLRSEFQNIQNSKDGQIPGISREDILYKIFPLPPLNEQERISDRILELFELVIELENLNKGSKIEADYLLNAILRETFQQKPKEYSHNEIPLSIAAEP